jgi:hypothetical protein
VDARIFADLIDLQKKFSDVLGSFKRSADAATAALMVKIIVSFKSGSALAP